VKKACKAFICAVIENYCLPNEPDALQPVVRAAYEALK
jgi:hypothetical protein